MPYSTKTSAEKAAQASAIAHALGDDWMVAELSEGEREMEAEAVRFERLETHVGRTLQHLSAERQRIEHYSLKLEWVSDKGVTRLEISGRWPSTNTGQIKTAKDGSSEERRKAYVTSITVDAGKPAAVIAKEIGRRLLPDYLTAFGVAMQAVETTEAYWRETAETFEQVVSAGARPSSQPEHYRGWLIESYADTISASGRSVRFEAFSCPIDIALRIIEAARQPAGVEAAS